MSLADLIRLSLIGSMMLLVFSLGLRAAGGNVIYLFHRPSLLVRSALAMNVLMPLMVIPLLIPLNLRPAVKVALVALSVAPIPPFLPAKQLKLTSREGYVYSLLVISAVLSVATVPLTTQILESYLVHGEHVRMAVVAKAVLISVLLPLSAGMLIHRLWPNLSQRVAPGVSRSGTVLLILAFLPVLFSQWPQIRSLIGDGTLLAIIGFTCLGLLIGHLLGGPDPRDRTVLALATASRHPAVALAVATALFPDQKLAPAAVLLSLITSSLATAPYTSRRRSGASDSPGSVSSLRNQHPTNR